MKRALLSILFACLLCGSAAAQALPCGTDQRFQALAAQDPAELARRLQSEAAIRRWLDSPAKAQAVVTIPVVVHVVYNTANENISDTQIVSQLAVLNADYRRLNADTLGTGHPFWPDAADTEIQFCLATTDPNGAPTNGITRTQTSTTSFTANDAVKSSATGGKDNWDPTSYLNIWVCDLSALTGYASFPGALASAPSLDGVVISYRAFGTMGTAAAPFNRGRTATHEIGHWLNLYHIFSGPPCGDDSILDTPVPEDHAFGCPTFPYNPNNSCGAGPNGEMFMNFMCFVDDSCMNLFTNGQKARMQAVLNTVRVGIQSSAGCSTPTAMAAPSVAELAVAPNPTTGRVALSWQGQAAKNASVTVVNTLGEIVYQSEISAFPFDLSLNDLPNDLYFVRVQSGDGVAVKKVVLAR